MKEPAPVISTFQRPTAGAVIVKLCTELRERTTTSPSVAATGVPFGRRRMTEGRIPACEAVIIKVTLSRRVSSTGISNDCGVASTNSTLRLNKLATSGLLSSRRVGTTSSTSARSTLKRTPPVASASARSCVREEAEVRGSLSAALGIRAGLPVPGSLRDGLSAAPFVPTADSEAQSPVRIASMLAPRRSASAATWGTQEGIPRRSVRRDEKAATLQLHVGADRGNMLESGEHRGVGGLGQSPPPEAERH